MASVNETREQKLERVATAAQEALDTPSRAQEILAAALNDVWITAPARAAPTAEPEGEAAAQIAAFDAINAVYLDEFDKEMPDELRQEIVWHIDELKGECFFFSDQARQLEAQLAQRSGIIAKMQQKQEELRAALLGLCPQDSPCLCADWMVTPPGTKCPYCVAREALRESSAPPAPAPPAESVESAEDVAGDIICRATDSRSDDSPFEVCYGGVFWRLRGHNHRIIHDAKSLPELRAALSAPTKGEGDAQ